MVKELLSDPPDVLCRRLMYYDSDGLNSSKNAEQLAVIGVYI
jgi:hypothetical protein